MAKTKSMAPTKAALSDQREWTAKDIVRRAIEASPDFSKQVKQVMKELKALEKRVRA